MQSRKKKSVNVKEFIAHELCINYYDEKGIDRYSRCTIYLV